MTSRFEQRHGSRGTASADARRPLIDPGLDRWQRILMLERAGHDRIAVAGYEFVVQARAERD